MSSRDQWAPGQAILNWSWSGTAVFTGTAVAATIRPGWFQGPNLVVSLVLFSAGSAAMLWAFWIAVQRSRHQVIGIGGLYLAAGSAPKEVRKILLTALAVQTVVAVTTASIRMYTSAAFGILVPVWGLGLTGLWCARFGEFEVRQTDPQSG